MEEVVLPKKKGVTTKEDESAEDSFPIHDLLGPDELSQIFHALPHTDWLNALLVCTHWHTLAGKCFKQRLLPILSHHWTGWSKWTSRFLKPVECEEQAITTEMKFLRDNTLTGEGKNQGFDSTWIVYGTYDLDTNFITWSKEFIDGHWSGRTIKYQGKLAFHEGSVSIEGTTVLLKKECQDSPWDVIGDTGAFCITAKIFL